jgi:hypothetical protein
MRIPRIPAQVGRQFHAHSAIRRDEKLFHIPRLAERAVLALLGASGGRIAVEWVAGIRGIRKLKATAFDLISESRAGDAN